MTLTKNDSALAFRTPAAGADWRDLRRKFLRTIRHEGDAPNYRRRWAMFVDHPWYQRELRRIAAYLVRRDARLAAWEEDIAQDAMLLLARKLERLPDLNYDFRRTERSFPGWLGTIITNDCRQAARRLRRACLVNSDLTPLLIAPDAQARSDARLDVLAAIEDLQEPFRTVVALHMQSVPVEEIARSISTSRTNAYRLLQNARRQLRRRLPDHTAHG